MQQMMMIAQRIAAGGVAVTWDPATKSSPAVLSAGNIRLATTSGTSGTYGNARSTRAIQGLCYVSVSTNTDSTGEVLGAGICDSTFPQATTSRWVGDGTTSVGLWFPASTGYFNGSPIGTATGSPTFIEMAVRVASRKVWLRAEGGAWLGGGDPVADTSPTATLTGTGALYVVGSIDRRSATSARWIEIASTAGTTTGTVPSGFTAANWA